jgi:hypothetical protein
MIFDDKLFMVMAVCLFVLFRSASLPPTSSHTVLSRSSITAANQTRLGTSFLGMDEEEEARRLYGSGFAMKLATERRIAAEMGNIGVAGMPSSNMMMDILSGNDMKMDFEDILNLPEHRPLFVKHQEDPHAMMERKLGMM